MKKYLSGIHESFRRPSIDSRCCLHGLEARPHTILETRDRFGPDRTGVVGDVGVECWRRIRCFSPPLEEAVMRRSLVFAVLALVVFAIPALPVSAQTPPPAPKVTITGTFDQMTAMGANIYDGNFSRDNDREWYARTRFRPDLEFAVGRTKAVLGIEIDLNYGQTGSNDSGFPGKNAGTACGFSSGCKGAGSAGAGLDSTTDVAR